MNFCVVPRSRGNRCAFVARCRRKSIRQEKKYLPTAPGLAQEHGVHPITVSRGTIQSGGQRQPGRPGLVRPGSVFNSTPYNSTYPFTASEDCL